MIIVEPVALTDISVNGGGGTYCDKNGVQRTATANILRVTYDPSDLSKAPYALVEPSAVNLQRYSSDLSNSSAWMGANFAPIPDTDIAPDGTLSADTWLVPQSGASTIIGHACSVIPGDTITISRFVKRLDGADWVYLSLRAPDFQHEAGVFFNISTGEIGATTVLAGIQCSPVDGAAVIEDWRNGWYRVSAVFRTAVTATVVLTMRAARLNGQINSPIEGDSYLLWGAQLEVGEGATSYIPTQEASVSRAADVIGQGSGLVYSNVPIVEPVYSASTTYAKDAVVFDPTSHGVFKSLIANNIGKQLSDTSAWVPRGAANRWAMFDEYNNTQTVLQDQILVVLTAEMVAQGLYLGNLDIDQILISMVDPVEGVIYKDDTNLIESNSSASFFNWAFRRIKRRSYFFTLDLPVYANSLVTICLRKVGGEAKCGMCAIGPVDEFGPTLLGLSTEGKDFSSTTFNFDGTSKTTIRPYAKRMSCDVVVDNEEITYVQDRLFELRQRPIVWVGGPYGITAVFGRYGSFKNVIEYQVQSKMNLTIEGAV